MKFWQDSLDVQTRSAPASWREGRAFGQLMARGTPSGHWLRFWWCMYVLCLQVRVPRIYDPSRCFVVDHRQRGYNEGAKASIPDNQAYITPRHERIKTDPLSYDVPQLPRKYPMLTLTNQESCNGAQCWCDENNTARHSTRQKQSSTNSTQPLGRQTVMS